MSLNAPSQQPRLKLKVLDAPQRALWAELGDTPSQFTLYGGTALALQIGHRKSVDFDFFTSTPFDHNALADDIAYLVCGAVKQRVADTLTVIVDRGGPVQVSFFRPRRPMTMIGTPIDIKRPRLRLASTIDIAATKLNVITHRASARDYVDIHALLTKCKLDLATMLAAVPAVFNPSTFNPVPILKALAYHGDPDVAALPERVRRDLRDAVAAVDRAAFPALVQRYRQDPDLWKKLP